MEHKSLGLYKYYRQGLRGTLGYRYKQKAFRTHLLAFEVDQVLLVGAGILLCQHLLAGLTTDSASTSFEHSTIHVGITGLEFLIALLGVAVSHLLAKPEISFFLILFFMFVNHLYFVTTHKLVYTEASLLYTTYCFLLTGYNFLLLCLIAITHLTANIISYFIYRNDLSLLYAYIHEATRLGWLLSTPKTPHHLKTAVLFTLTDYKRLLGLDNRFAILESFVFVGYGLLLYHVIYLYAFLILQCRGSFLHALTEFPAMVDMESIVLAFAAQENVQKKGALLGGSTHVPVGVLPRLPLRENRAHIMSLNRAFPRDNLSSYSNTDNEGTYYQQPWLLMLPFKKKENERPSIFRAVYEGNTTRDGNSIVNPIIKSLKQS